MNSINRVGATPAMQAVSWGGQYDIALMLLETGADHRIYRPNSNTRLVHQVKTEDRLRATWSPEQSAAYDRLVAWLEDHGESLQQAGQDVERWQSWSISRGEFRRNMDAETAERKAREAKEKAAAEKADDAAK